jgi:hypothetical protein
MHGGGGIRAERILLEWVPLTEANASVFDKNRTETAGLMFAFYRFFGKRKK